MHIIIILPDIYSEIKILTFDTFLAQCCFWNIMGMHKLWSFIKSDVDWKKCAILPGPKTRQPLQSLVGGIHLTFELYIHILTTCNAWVKGWTKIVQSEYSV